VRKLFEDAEADQKAHGDASELHVIIFDEIDAICKSRGSVQSGSGAQALPVEVVTMMDTLNPLYRAFLSDSLSSNQC